MWKELLATPLCQHLHDCGLPLFEDQVVAWEHTLPGRLPEDYRRFLMCFNGGCYYDPISYSMGGRGVAGRAAFTSIGGFNFFGLNCDGWAEWRDLQLQWEDHDSRIPECTLPIGDNGGDDLILIDFRNDCELVLWERDAEEAVDREQNRILIAPTFLDFARGVAIDDVTERRRSGLAETEPELSIEAHDLDSLKKWVATNGPLQELPDRGAGLLTAACANSDWSGVAWFLSEGANPTGSLAEDADTPIEAAESAGCGDIVVLLLEHGADPAHLYRGNREPQPYIVAFAEQWKAGRRTSNRISQSFCADVESNRKPSR